MNFLRDILANPLSQHPLVTGIIIAAFIATLGVIGFLARRFLCIATDPSTSISAEIKKKLKDLNELMNEGEHIAKNIHTNMKNGENWSPMDAFVLGSLHRTINYVDAISILSEKCNIVAFLPYVRLLLDTLLRLHYVCDVATDQHRIADEWIQGTKRFDQIVSSDGEPLQDKFLREKILNVFPKIEQWYEAASNHTHFSYRHFWSAVESSDSQNQILSIRIGRRSDISLDENLLKFLNGIFNNGKRIVSICDQWSKSRSSPFHPQR